MTKLLAATFLGVGFAFGSACLSHPAPVPHKHDLSDVGDMGQNGHLCITEHTETAYFGVGKNVPHVH